MNCHPRRISDSLRMPAVYKPLGSPLAPYPALSTRPCLLPSNELVAAWDDHSVNL